MTDSTNLALRPFRNERLPWLLAGLLFGVALFVSFLHGRFINRLLSGDEAKTVRAVREDEARIAELDAGIDKEPPLKIETAELARLRVFKDLVDRRVFPWRRLLAELENTLSEDVRLTRISPASARGARGMLIELSGDARTKDAAFSLAEALDGSPLFSDAVLKSLNDNQGVTEFELEVVFDPPDALFPAAASAGKPSTVAPSATPATSLPGKTS